MQEAGGRRQEAGGRRQEAYIHITQSYVRAVLQIIVMTGAAAARAASSDT